MDLQVASEVRELHEGRVMYHRLLFQLGVPELQLCRERLQGVATLQRGTQTSGAVVPMAAVELNLPREKDQVELGVAGRDAAVDAVEARAEVPVETCDTTFSLHPILLQLMPLGRVGRGQRIKVVQATAVVESKVEAENPIAHRRHKSLQVTLHHRAVARGMGGAEGAQAVEAVGVAAAEEAVAVVVAVEDLDNIVVRKNH